MKKLILLLSFVLIALLSPAQTRDDYGKYKNKPVETETRPKVLDENYHYTDQYPYPHYRYHRERGCRGHRDGWARQQWHYFVEGIVALAAAATGYVVYEEIVQNAP